MTPPCLLRVCESVNIVKAKKGQYLHDATLFTSSLGRKCTVKKGFYSPSTQDSGRTWWATMVKYCVSSDASPIMSVHIFR